VINRKGFEISQKTKTKKREDEKKRRRMLRWKEEINEHAKRMK